MSEKRNSPKKESWRNLEELYDTPAYRAAAQREFPGAAADWPRGLDRREFLNLVSASLALGGLSGCTKQPPEQIAPYVRQPEQVVPGQSLFYATAMSLSGIGTGVLVESHEGRPTKIEGNPDHPGSLGATDVFGQASVLGLYDSDRSQTVQYAGAPATWEQFQHVIEELLTVHKRTRGAGLRLLLDSFSSPTLLNQLGALLAMLPEARWLSFEPVNRDAARRGSRLAFGVEVDTLYRFDRADRVLSIDADFLCGGAGSLRYTRDFARMRRPEGGPPVRLYAVETTPTNTGLVADHRLALRPSEILSVVYAVAAGVGVAVDVMPSVALTTHMEWISALVRDLRDHPGTSLAIAGDGQPPLVHALCHAINGALHGAGNTVLYVEPVVAGPPQLDSLVELCTDLEAGRVDTLLILDPSGGCNPVYTAPANLRFADRLAQARNRLHFGPYFDETAAHCEWHVPATHYLESWSDTRAYDGTVSIVQPLIAPLYEGRTVHEILDTWISPPGRRSYEIIRSYWRNQYQGTDFESFFRGALDHGVIAGTESPQQPVSLRPLPVGEPDPPVPWLEVVFRPDSAVYDGRFANNGWLQELPRPLSRLTWDNVALLSPNTARRLGLSQREGSFGKELFTEVVELTLRGRTLRAPVFIAPGQPDECITLTLGYGRRRAGRVGSGVGYNAYALRTVESLWSGIGLTVRKLNEHRGLASAQLHFLMEGREPVRSASFAEYQRDPAGMVKKDPPPPRSLTLYPEYPYPDHAWGMSIDLSACVGCSACVVACQAENNIPVVGKDQVARGREMHWLRIDLYYKGELEEPQGFFQPIPCMHCENAPCELVCPVGATVHSSEGLNDMVYNRCVGTRYCSNNCPYKVRRFNFLYYADDSAPALLQKNPNVTVRSRGVMEKCTYCVQRISAARIRSEEQGRSIADGEVVTACQAACPAQAIVFGDINDRQSRVWRQKQLPRNYALLAELNTRPRTTYLSAVRNPNPEMPRQIPQKGDKNGRG